VTENRLCGVSRVAHPATETSDGPPFAGPWEGRLSYYRIDLTEFQNLPATLPLRLITETYEAELLAELSEDEPRHYPFARYGSAVRPNQGMYLSRATPRLIQLITAAYGIEVAATEPAAPSASSEAQREFAEGQRHKRERYFFSRNPRLVAAAKENHGYRCMVCGFDFEATYGELGKGYIECHHVDPLSERAERDWSDGLKTDIDDVVVLCANCPTEWSSVNAPRCPSRR